MLHTRPTQLLEMKNERKKVEEKQESRIWAPIAGSDIETRIWPPKNGAGPSQEKIKPESFVMSFPSQVNAIVWALYGHQINVPDITPQVTPLDLTHQGPSNPYSRTKISILLLKINFNSPLSSLIKLHLKILVPHKVCLTIRGLQSQKKFQLEPPVPKKNQLELWKLLVTLTRYLPCLMHLKSFNKLIFSYDNF